MAKGASGRTSNDYRKLQTIKKDLLALKRELVPGQPSGRKQNERKRNVATLRGCFVLREASGRRDHIH